MKRARLAALSLVASFSVYLIPLLGPHAQWLLAEVLFPGDAGQSSKWIAANLAVAFFVQLLAAASFYWFFRKPRWLRAVPLALGFVAAFPVLQWVYLAAIPAIFLEEPDVAVENTSWPVVCTAPRVYQTDLKTPGELWVRYSNEPNKYAVLTMPGCRLAPVTLPQPKFTPGSGVDFSIDVTSVIPNGRAIVRRVENPGGKTSWWMVPGVHAEIDPGLLPLQSPTGDSGATPPILSNDGRWVACLEIVPGSGPPVLYRVLLRPRDPDVREKTVDLSALGPATYFLRSLDMESEELVLWKGDRLVAVGFDGKFKREFAQPAVVQPQPNTYMEMGKYWLAWDAYRDDAPYRMEWSLPSGSGSHRAPLGRTIHSAAVDASGKWIGVSVGTTLNVGKAQDAVYVLRASDGREVFRNYLPRWSRSPVAFLNGGFFAYSDRGGVTVRRIPD